MSNLGQRDHPAFERLDRIGRTEYQHVRHDPQPGQRLDRMVGRPVLADADGVVGEHVDHPLPHQRRHPHAAAHVVGEDQEGAAVGDEPAVQRHAVHHRRHRMLAHAVVDVAAAVVAGNDVRLWPVLVKTESARSAEPPIISGKVAVRISSASPEALRVAHFGRSSASLRLNSFSGTCQPGRSLPRWCGEMPPASRPAARRTAAPMPRAPGSAAAAVAPGGEDVRRDHERRIGPAEGPADARHLVLAERRPVGCSVPCLVGAPLPMIVRQSISDGLSDSLALAMARGYRFRIVAVDDLRVPAAGLEAGELVVACGEPRRPVDRDAVVVPQHDQLGQPSKPASEIASWLSPSIRQPSPTMQ